MLMWACLAVLGATTGCVPDLFRRDADRQVLQIVRSEQQRAIGYTPQVSVPITESAQTTKKSYARLPLTPMPDLLTDVISSATISEVEEEAARRRRVQGPVESTPSAGLSALQQYSAVGRVRSLIRDRYVLGPDEFIASARQFGLFDAIAYAVENSRQYRGEMEDLYASALDVTLERHLFTPRPFANVRAGYSGGQASVDYRSALTVTGEAGVRQRLPLGGEIVASGLVSFINALNDNTADGEDATLSLSASIPLLRGAGFINLENLIQSERSLVYAVRNFETYRRSFAIDVASAYFRLITRQQAIRNRYVRYTNTVELTNRTEALFDAGRITALEVQRAQQDLLQSEDALNDALEAYENELDRFKLTTGMPMTQVLEIVPVQLDVPTPHLDFDLATALAKQFRLDLQTARDRIEDARRRVKNAENGLLPDLDLDLGGSLGNPNDDPARKINSDTLVYNGGVRLDLPLDRLPERNTYRLSLLNLEAAKRNVLQLDDQVVSDVRARIRGIRSALVSLDLQQQGIGIARARLESANEFLLTGRTSDSRNVLEAQTSLLLAQDQFEQARADLQVAILSYLRDTGVLRLDPSSGELGLAMERQGNGESTTRPVETE
jgi:outer membrane protein TolC